MLVQKGTTRYENDALKRRVRKLERREDGTDAVTTYHWDSRDRLREVGLPDGRRVRYRYDAFSRRVEKEVVHPAAGELSERVGAALRGEGAPLAVETTRFLWDGDVLCAELRAAGAALEPLRIHVHEPGIFVPLLQVEGAQVLMVACDHLGMPKELVDPRGRVAWAAAHAAWGASCRHGSAGCRCRFLASGATVAGMLKNSRGAFACWLALPLVACQVGAAGDEGPPPVATTIPRAAPAATGADYPIPSSLPTLPPEVDPDVPPPPFPVPPPLPELPPPAGGAGGEGTHL